MKDINIKQQIIRYATAANFLNLGVSLFFVSILFNILNLTVVSDNLSSLAFLIVACSLLKLFWGDTQINKKIDINLAGFPLADFAWTLLITLLAVGAFLAAINHEGVAVSIIIFAFYILVAAVFIYLVSIRK